MKKYIVTFIKDRPIDNRKKGDKYGPINKEGYINLLNQGWIEDEHGLAKTKKEKPKNKQKTKIEEINLED
jgi:hypothetical protein|tara:strand:+ start:856 stop:1065 length:210 start_codon:yes stop_codon:yes gene_type:complete